MPALLAALAALGTLVLLGMLVAGPAGSPANRASDGGIRVSDRDGSGIAATHREAKPRPTPAAAFPTDSFHARFDGLRLTDHHGRPFDAGTIAGHPVLLNFVFTGCSAICPLQTRVLADVRAALPPAARRDVRFVSVTVDPVHDTPATLAAFAAAQGAGGEGWSFVTGPVADVDALAERLRAKLAPDRPDSHTTAVWLVDGGGHVLMRYHGNPPDAARLVSELSRLSSMAKR